MCKNTLLHKQTYTHKEIKTRGESLLEHVWLTRCPRISTTKLVNLHTKLTAADLVCAIVLKFEKNDKMHWSVFCSHRSLRVSKDEHNFHAGIFK